MKKNKLAHLKTSKIHNKGLYTIQAIAEDTPIIQYVGAKISQKQADKIAQARPHACIYLFELNQRYVIDGDVDYNLAKYINHSCEPNCYTDIVNDEIWIYALRDLHKNEELVYDYGFQRSDWAERPCLCGAKDCFGFIVAQEHWNAIRKTKRYQRLTQS